MCDVTIIEQSKRSQNLAHNKTSSCIKTTIIQSYCLVLFQIGTLFIYLTHIFRDSPSGV